MRPLEFRVFYMGDFTYISEPNDFKFFCSSYGTPTKSEWPENMSQYTGLKDKNGVKIFEGDIIKTTYDGILTVEWRDDLGSCGCCYEPFSGSGFIAGDSECEILGNIYENPELLEADSNE